MKPTTATVLGTLRDGHHVRYLLNYSASPAAIPATLTHGTDLLANVPAASMLGAWGVAILED